MNVEQIIIDIEQLREYVKKRTNSYFYDSELTEIVDSQLNAKNKVLLKYLKDYNLMDYYETIKNEFDPIMQNAITYLEYVDSIKDEILECAKWNNPKDRLSLINNIAYSFQEKYNINEINIILNSVGITNIDDSIPRSKRVYLQEVLRNEPINKIVKLAKSDNLMETLIDVEEVSILSNAYLEKQINKCIIKINNDDYDGAITNARTMVEELLLDIEEKITGKREKNEGDLPKIYKRVRKLLSLEPNDSSIDNTLNEIMIGFNNIINGLSGISNNSGDRHATTYRPDKRHAILVVNSCLTMCKFLISSYEYQFVTK